MNTNTSLQQFRSLVSLTKKIRKDLKGARGRKKSKKSKGVTPIKGHDFVLIFAHNGVGKTRLSTEFKDLGKKDGKRDTLYFNAFTEDLFDWDNDFENDKERKLKFKSHSEFFSDLEGMDIEEHIRPHLHRYADFNFTIDYEKSEISFSREMLIKGKSERIDNIKISRGEENIFIWCFFLAVAQLAIEAEKGQPYDWVKFIYIDDPISSLDEHNTITIASQLASLLKAGKDSVKVVISTHHSLFFNVIFNELKSGKTESGEKIKITKKAYVLHRSQDSINYTLRDTGESPFLHHMFALYELQKVDKSGHIYPHHFNILRSILEKTAIFFGRQHISACFGDNPKRAVYSRFLHVKSHAKYSMYDPEAMSVEDKTMFGEILDTFLDIYPFNLQKLKP